MQFIVQANVSITAAVRHALTSVLSVSPSDIINSPNTFGVKVEGRVYGGLLPLVRALRMSVHSEEQKAFLGATAAHTALVDQWVAAASMLSYDSAQVMSNRSPLSVSGGLFKEIESAIDHCGLKNAFLSGTSRATIADVFLYAALHNHPHHTDILPSTLAWSVYAQEDAYLGPIKSDHVQKHLCEKSDGGAKKSTPVYVKPTEEEISRRRMLKEQQKKEKEAQKSAGASTVPTSSRKEAWIVPSNLEIRVGRITAVERHPDADRLYVEQMDLGIETRTIVSGLVEHYKVEEITGTLCLVVCNMKPKPLKGITSHGMVLCASDESGLCLVRPPADAKPGERIVFSSASPVAGAEEAGPDAVSGSQMTELLSHLHTNDECELCWKDLLGRYHSSAIIVPNMSNCVVK